MIAEKIPALLPKTLEGRPNVLKGEERLCAQLSLSLYRLKNPDEEVKLLCFIGNLDKRNQLSWIQHFVLSLYTPKEG